VLLLFVISSYARFSTMVTKDEIEGICTKKDRDFKPSLCFEILKPTPETALFDFPGLAKFLLITSNTTDLQKFQLCEGRYDATLDDIDKALKALAAKDYYLLNMYASAKTDMYLCINELSTMKPVPEVLIKRSMIISDISSIVLVILECFIREEKIRCN
ncbi:hypothetical protein EUTSA_v10019766mg, partial [Eutrema salsugineum]